MSQEDNAMTKENRPATHSDRVSLPVQEPSAGIKRSCGNKALEPVTFRDSNAEMRRMLELSDQSRLALLSLAEDQLAGEQRYRNLVESVPDVIMRFDPEGRHLFVSPNVQRYVSFSAETMLRKTHRELGFSDEQSSFWERAIQQVCATGESWEDEFEFAGRQGPVVFNWRLIPEMDDHGVCRSVLSLARDVTRHREMEQRYKMLFDEMLDGFAVHEIVLDDQDRPVDYRFQTVNPAFERLTGLRREDVVGRTVRDIMPETERRWIETYGRVVSTGQPMRFQQYSSVLQKYFEVVAFRTEPRRFACIFVDITERCKAEARLLDYQGRLKALAAELTLTEEREKQNLAESLHDDVQQDLAFCRMTLQMLEEQASEGQIKQGLTHVTEVLGCTIESIRSLTFNLNLQVLKDLGLERAIAHWLQEQVQKKHGIETTLSIEGRLPALSWVQEAILFRSVRELLANAVKHGHCQRIDVTIHSNAAKTKIVVRDNGCGFDVLSLKEDHALKGFGLFSIRERLEQIEGILEIDSRAGEGTCVVLSMPMKPDMSKILEPGVDRDEHQSNHC
jgi:PAS domain S-box-containing protein